MIRLVASPLLNMQDAYRELIRNPVLDTAMSQELVEFRAERAFLSFSTGCVLLRWD
jgi:hypothetical protein